MLNGSVLACSTEAQRAASANPAPSGQLTQKQSVPISMQYQILTQSPQAGDEIEIEVSFQTSLNSMVSSKMTGAKRLNVVNAYHSQQPVLNQNMALKTSPQPNLKVTAPNDGVYYIHFIAETEQDGQTIAKPFVIPVKVGSGKIELEPVGKIVTDDKGQKVIIQEAESDK